MTARPGGPRRDFPLCVGWRYGVWGRLHAGAGGPCLFPVGAARNRGWSPRKFSIPLQGFDCFMALPGADAGAGSPKRIGSLRGRVRRLSGSDFPVIHMRFSVFPCGASPDARRKEGPARGEVPSGRSAEKFRKDGKIRSFGILPKGVGARFPCHPVAGGTDSRTACG